MTRVRVDFNSRGPHGWVRGSQRRADGPLVSGEQVVVYDPHEADMEFTATVREVDETTGRAFFDVEWETQEAAVAGRPGKAGR